MAAIRIRDSIFRRRVSSSRPRGRRPGSSDTRDAILAAARERFARHGYDRTRIRDVAEDAGVDAALVHYFFKSKDGLFVAAMQLPFRPADVIAPVLAEGVPGLGERIVRRLLGVWDDPANRSALLAIVQGASAHPGAAEALREFLRREMVGRIAGVIEAERPELRANLVASQIIGLVAARYIAQVQPLAGLSSDELAPLIGPTLQRYLDGPL
jgi:AcrR family transcriptional regulator